MLKSTKSAGLNSRWTIILLILNLGVSGSAFSQNLQERTDEFNAVVGKEYNISTKGSTLIINGFSQGKQMKVEQLDVSDLDMESLKYSHQDGTVSVKCYSDLDGCVQQKLLLEKEKRYMKRLVFAVAGDEVGKGVEAKLRSLLQEMIKPK